MDALTRNSPTGDPSATVLACTKNPLNVRPSSAMIRTIMKQRMPALHRLYESDVILTGVSRSSDIVVGVSSWGVKSRDVKNEGAGGEVL